MKLSKEDKIVYAGSLAIFILILLIFTALLIWYNSVINYRAVIKKIKNTKPKDISSIIIDKSSVAKSKSLVLHRLIISDERSINRIWEAISLEKEYKPAHPIGKWVCLLEINTKNGDKISIQVKKLKTLKSFGERGTKLTFLSHAESGFLFGEFRSDKLGRVLETLTKEKGGSGVKP